MDSHYEQVQRARAASADAPAKVYFAYSTILDRKAFDEWRMQHSYESFSLPRGVLAQAVDLALVFDFPSRWWGGRVAGLADKPGDSVWGVLFEIPGVDWPIIEHKEGAVTEMCIERQVRVVVDGVEKIASAFTTNPRRASSDGPISDRFIEGDAARGLGIRPARRIHREHRREVTLESPAWLTPSSPPRPIGKRSQAPSSRPSSRAWWWRSAPTAPAPSRAARWKIG